MVDFKRVTDRAKDLVEKRGGTESLKEDAAELRDIAKGPGSVKDKAKAAVEALKDPGEEPASAAETAGAAEQARAAGKVEGEERGKHAHAGEKHGHGRHRKGSGRHGGQGRGDGDPAV
jgi:hypothetical protein